MSEGERFLHDGVVNTKKHNQYMQVNRTVEHNDTRKQLDSFEDTDSSSNFVPPGTPVRVNFASNGTSGAY